MRPIEILLLVVQVAVLLASAWAMVMRRPSPQKRRPLWTSLAFSTLIISMVSFQVADRHAGDAGSQLVLFGAPILLGFAIALLLMAIRERRFGAAG